MSYACVLSLFAFFLLYLSSCVSSSFLLFLPYCPPTVCVSLFQWLITFIPHAECSSVLSLVWQLPLVLFVLSD